LPLEGYSGASFAQESEELKARTQDRRTLEIKILRKVRDIGLLFKSRDIFVEIYLPENCNLHSLVDRTPEIVSFQRRSAAPEE
jgi:hypothetical protein